ncbi:hypothetical protein HDV00_003056, partial [Rhizophlyctis rosea]
QFAVLESLQGRMYKLYRNFIGNHQELLGEQTEAMQAQAVRQMDHLHALHDRHSEWQASSLRRLRHDWKEEIDQFSSVTRDAKAVFEGDKRDVDRSKEALPNIGVRSSGQRMEVNHDEVKARFEGVDELQAELKALRADFNDFLLGFDEVRKGWSDPNLDPRGASSDMNALREALASGVQHAEEDFDRLHASMGFSPLDDLLHGGTEGDGARSNRRRRRRKDGPTKHATQNDPFTSTSSSPHSELGRKKEHSSRRATGDIYDYSHVKRVLQQLQRMSQDMMMGPYLPAEASSPFQPHRAVEIADDVPYADIMQGERIRSKVKSVIEGFTGDDSGQASASRLESNLLQPTSRQRFAAAAPDLPIRSPAQEAELDADHLQWEILDKMQSARLADAGNRKQRAARTARNVPPSRGKENISRDIPVSETPVRPRKQHSEVPAQPKMVDTKTDDIQSGHADRKKQSRPGSPLRPPNFYNVRLSNAPIFLRRTTIRPPSLKFLDRRTSPQPQQRERPTNLETEAVAAHLPFESAPRESYPAPNITTSRVDAGTAPEEVKAQPAPTVLHTNQGVQTGPEVVNTATQMTAVADTYTQVTPPISMMQEQPAEIPRSVQEFAVQYSEQDLSAKTEQTPQRKDTGIQYTSPLKNASVQYSTPTKSSTATWPPKPVEAAVPRYPRPHIPERDDMTRGQPIAEVQTISDNERDKRVAEWIQNEVLLRLLAANRSQEGESTSPEHVDEQIQAEMPKPPTPSPPKPAVRLNLIEREPPVLEEKCIGTDEAAIITPMILPPTPQELEIAYGLVADAIADDVVSLETHIITRDAHHDVLAELKRAREEAEKAKLQAEEAEREQRRKAEEDARQAMVDEMRLLRKESEDRDARRREEADLQKQMWASEEQRLLRELQEAEERGKRMREEVERKAAEEAARLAEEAAKARELYELERVRKEKEIQGWDAQLREKEEEMRRLLDEARVLAQKSVESVEIQTTEVVEDFPEPSMPAEEPYIAVPEETPLPVESHVSTDLPTPLESSMTNPATGGSSLLTSLGFTSTLSTLPSEGEVLTNLYSEGEVLSSGQMNVIRGTIMENLRDDGRISRERFTHRSRPDLDRSRGEGDVGYVGKRKRREEGGKSSGTTTEGEITTSSGSDPTSLGEVLIRFGIEEGEVVRQHDRWGEVVDEAEFESREMVADRPGADEGSWSSPEEGEISLGLIGHRQKKRADVSTHAGPSDEVGVMGRSSRIPVPDQGPTRSADKSPTSHDEVRSKLRDAFLGSFRASLGKTRGVGSRRRSRESSSREGLARPGSASAGSKALEDEVYEDTTAGLSEYSSDLFSERHDAGMSKGFLRVQSTSVQPVGRNDSEGDFFRPITGGDFPSDVARDSIRSSALNQQKRDDNDLRGGPSERTEPSGEENYLPPGSKTPSRSESSVISSLDFSKLRDQSGRGGRRFMLPDPREFLRNERMGGQHGLTSLSPLSHEQWHNRTPENTPPSANTRSPVSLDVTRVGDGSHQELNATLDHLSEIVHVPFDRPTEN